MIKAVVAGASGKKTIILGLSDENLRRLREDMPILVEGSTVGIESDIAIVAGRTEEELARQIKGGLGWPKI